MEKHRHSIISTLCVMAIVLPMAVACTEDDMDEVEEYPNWKETNEEYFESLSDSVIALIEADPDRTDWMRIKSWSKDEDEEGESTDYIIVNVIEAGDEDGGCPIYTDTVEVSYTGRLLPSVSYPSGYVFDRTFYGDYDPELSASTTLAIGDSYGTELIDGFATALQNMRCGDHWKVYIPYQLGYGSSGSSSVPGYSTLIFDTVLLDFWGAVLDIE